MAPSSIPSPALTPLCPAKGLLRRRVCVERCVSPLSSLMRVKRLTGLLPAIISIALQVSLRTAGPHGRSILLPASPGCCELVGAQLGHPERKRWKSDLSIHFFFFNQKSSLDKRVLAGCSPVATSPAPVLLAVPWEQLCSIPALGRSPGDSAAGCHSDGALAQHPSDSAGLAQVGREKNTPGMGTPPAAGLGKLRHGRGRRRGDGGGFWKLPMG